MAQPIPPPPLGYRIVDNSVPAPPPGYTIQTSGQSPADFAKAQNASTAQGILQQVRQQQLKSPQMPQTQEPYSRVDHLADMAGAVTDNVIGAGKGALDTTLKLGQLAVPGAQLLPKYQTPNALKPNGMAQSSGHAVEQAAEFAVPGSGEEQAAAFASKYVPKLAPFIGNAAKFAPTAAKYGAAALGSGGLNAVQNPDEPNAFAIGAGAGVGGRLLGDTAKAVAPKLAEIALGIREKASMFGATPGEAILSQTKGIRPGNIASQVNSRLSALESDLQHAATAPTGATVDIQPARDVVDRAMTTAEGRNTPQIYKNLGKLNSQLNTEFISGNPIPQNVAPDQAIALRRGLNDEIRTWRPNDASAVDSTSKQAYHNITEGLHSAVPETRPIDQQISSLIPAQKAATNKEFSAGIFERAAGRLAKHTGAAVLGGIGANKGYERGGIPGAIAGGALGVIAPEVLSSPEVGMALARSANVFGSPAAKPGIDLTKGYLLQLLKQGRLY